MSFSDSHLFEINDDGVPLHKRSGASYADRTIHGVSLDDSLYWEYEMTLIDYNHHRVRDEGLKDKVVGERPMGGEIKESATFLRTERGERPFRRERRLPVKKKKFPTKPKHSWNKRLSKIANELGDLGPHTEAHAWEELEEVHWNIAEDRRKKREKDGIEYRSIWEGITYPCGSE
jgi:hypothetical protein